MCLSQHINMYVFCCAHPVILPLHMRSLKSKYVSSLSLTLFLTLCCACPVPADSGKWPLANPLTPCISAVFQALDTEAVPQAEAEGSTEAAAPQQEPSSAGLEAETVAAEAEAQQEPSTVSVGADAEPEPEVALEAEPAAEPAEELAGVAEAFVEVEAEQEQVSYCAKENRLLQPICFTYQTVRPVQPHISAKHLRCLWRGHLALIAY